VNLTGGREQENKAKSRSNKNEHGSERYAERLRVDDQRVKRKGLATFAQRKLRRVEDGKVIRWMGRTGLEIHQRSWGGEVVPFRKGNGRSGKSAWINDTASKGILCRNAGGRNSIKGREESEAEGFELKGRHERSREWRRRGSP